MKKVDHEYIYQIFQNLVYTFEGKIYMPKFLCEKILFFDPKTARIC